MTENTIEELKTSLETIGDNIYRMNGTLMKEGDVGKRLADAAETLKNIDRRLEQMNWNLGSISKSLKEFVERGGYSHKKD